MGWDFFGIDVFWKVTKTVERSPIPQSPVHLLTRQFISLWHASETMAVYGGRPQGGEDPRTLRLGSTCVIHAVANAAINGAT